MQSIAPWTGLIASGLMVLLSLFGLYTGFSNKDSKSEFQLIPKLLWIIILLIGLLVCSVCFSVLFDEKANRVIMFLYELFSGA